MGCFNTICCKCNDEEEKNNKTEDNGRTHISVITEQPKPSAIVVAQSNDFDKVNYVSESADPEPRLSVLERDAIAQLLKVIEESERSNNALDVVDTHEAPVTGLKRTTKAANLVLYDDPTVFENLDKDEMSPEELCDKYALYPDESVKAGNKNCFKSAVVGKIFSPRNHLQVVSAEQCSLFESECLKWHNEFRKIHGVPLLVHSEFLSKVARDWAEQMALADNFDHRPNNEYGENLYRGHVMYAYARRAVTVWYNEINSYDYGDPKFSEATGHFTNLVWRDTREIGIGVVWAGDFVWVCCNYYPQGNCDDKFNDEYIPRPIQSGLKSK